MSGVMRYSDMQIADAFTRFRMAIKGNTVPDTEMWVREIDYDALRADFLNAVQGRDIAINERDLWKDSARAFKAERDAALAECARLRAALEQEHKHMEAQTEIALRVIAERDALRAELVRISKGTVRAGTSSSTSLPE